MRKVLIHLSILPISLVPLLSYAACSDAGNFGLCNPINVDSISDLIYIVARVVRYIAIPFVIIAIMYSGWLFIGFSAGLPNYTIKGAKDSLWYTVLGAFILLSAELIALAMKNTIESLTN
jgi:hypothetical protein